jgi:hypothetical protein
MSNKKQKTTQPNGVAKQRVKVLYQNLGGTWYAFAHINDETFFAPIHLKAVAPQESTEPRQRVGILTRHSKDAA